MRCLADRIERYLKQMLAQSAQGVVEVQRNELAQMFTCVPSQINYVLATRFTLQQGYLVESRRGGGGYVRIVKIPLSREEKLCSLVEELEGALVSQQQGEGLIERLREEEILTAREALLLKAVTHRETLSLELPQRDLVRGRILRAALLALLKNGFSGGEKGALRELQAKAGNGTHYEDR